MLSDLVQQEAQALTAFFDESRLMRLGRRTKFVQRSSKLTPFVFLSALVLGFIQHPRASLSQLCQVCLDLGVLVTPQGLDQRLNGAAVLFLECLLKDALMSWRAKRQDICKVMNQFAAVLFLDSTTTSLPAALKQLFPGAGGNASPSAVKIQLLFDFLTGNIEHLSFEPGRAPDQGYDCHMAKIQADSLLIQDLGYFNLHLLQTLVGQDAFFLTRWKNDSHLYLAENPEVPLDMRAFLSRQTTETEEYPVFLGARARLPCRMISVRLPDAAIARRRQRAKANAKRKGETVSSRSLALLDWNIFLTNVPAKRLSLRHILVCYSLRWQVELVFKLWKSEAALKHLGGCRKERVLVELYAKMVGIVLTHFLVAPLRFLLSRHRIEISPVKARKVLQDRAKLIAMALSCDRLCLKTELACLCVRILHFARKTRRRHCPSTFDKLLDAQRLSISQLYPLA